MKRLQVKTLFESLAVIKDPRIERHKLHSLTNILMIAICATIRGKCQGSTASGERTLGASKMDCIGVWTLGFGKMIAK